MAQVEDPLVAALPPATDYITYLTLLEYQLKPSNLGTLNRLLSEDDGTLASEIGWDLLRLVLPMLQVVPDEGRTCLDIIARRGNPREVVVRVAEELGNLSNDHDEDDFESEDDEDTLPTFAGEATRIHLGQISLSGESTTDAKGSEPTHQQSHSDDVEEAEHGQIGTDDKLIFSALMSMLSIVHPRIKTQFPSRFLATSLPAALAAYRRLSSDNEVTLSFILALTKLAGRQRPLLPPRVPSRTPAAGDTDNTITTSNTVLLPDPEADRAEDAGLSSEKTNDNERQITRRLLQAVTTEVLDDYLQSIATTDIASMDWCSRARRKLHPETVFSARSAILDQWQIDQILITRDSIVRRCVDLAKDLSLDVSRGFTHLLDGEHSSSITNEENDYPTSTEDIPFSPSGLLLLHAATKFYQERGADTDIKVSNDAATDNLLRLVADWRIGPKSDSPATNDAALYLLFSGLSDDPKLISSESDHSLVLQLLSDLTDVFVTNPDDTIRENAYFQMEYVLSHASSSSIRLAYVEILCSESYAEKSSIHHAQSGNLTAIGINLLKDGIASEFIDVTVFNSDEQLLKRVFPRLPSVPGPFLSSHPPAAGTGSPGIMSTEEELESLLKQLPAYTAALNLLCVIGGHRGDKKEMNALVQYQPLLEKFKQFVSETDSWKSALVAMIDPSKHRIGASEPFNILDIYALEDACNRAQALMAHLDNEN